MRQGGLILAAGRVRSKNNKIGEEKHEKVPPHPKYTTKPTQQPGNRDRVETARDETRPTL